VGRVVIGMDPHKRVGGEHDAGVPELFLHGFEVDTAARARVAAPAACRVHLHLTGQVVRRNAWQGWSIEGDRTDERTVR
jgi:hypothetical protein